MTFLRRPETYIALVALTAGTITVTLKLHGRLDDWNWFAATAPFYVGTLFAIAFPVVRWEMADPAPKD